MAISGYYSIRDDDDVADWVHGITKRIADDLEETLKNPDWYRNHEGAAEILIRMTRPTVWGVDEKLPIDLTHEAVDRGLLELAIDRMEEILEGKGEYIEGFTDPRRKRAVIQRLQDALIKRMRKLDKDRRRR